MKIWQLVGVLLICAAIFACSSKDEESKVSRQMSIAATAGEGFHDTLRYDDGRFTNVVNIAMGDSFGVWFSPQRNQPCSLIAVQYFFGDSAFSLSNTVLGFIKRVPRHHDRGLRLMETGVPVAAFRFSPLPGAQITSVHFSAWGQPIAGEICSDFFIGLSVDSAFSSVILRDSVGNYNPERSYRISAGDNSLATPLPFDLGVRAVFQYADSQPDTGKLAFELRWDKQNTDLDLYLVLPVSGDTVFWRDRTSASGGVLDVDDNDGYGPEKIVHPFFVQFADSMAQLGVHYYGPGNGRLTKASVLVYLDNMLCQTLGPCMLKPNDWWRAATIDLQVGRILSDSCRIAPLPAHARRLKRR